MTPISVMLVDDNPTFLRAASQFLGAHDGVTVVGTANGGEEALEKAQALRPQVVLIDLAMPGLPGLKAIPRLREMLPKSGIIALTVMNTQGFREAALDAGANMFIPKAQMRTDLLPAIGQLVQNGGEELVRERTPDRRESARRILIIEDNHDLRRLYSKALRSAGYDVHSAGTMQVARDILSRIRFDLLLCDVHMGEGRGTDLLRDYSDLLFTNGAQVVMVSGHARYRDICAEMGADFFLEKPVAIGTLVTLVDRLTARHDFQPGA